MRVSNIKEYLGGADNVFAKEVIQGEQLIYDGTILDAQTKQPMNITSFNISAVAEFYDANVTISSGRAGSAGTATINSFTKTLDPNKTIEVTKVSPTVGKIQMTLPADLATPAMTAEIDETNVLVAVIYITYDDGNIAQTPTIRKNRLLVIIRYSAQEA